MNIPKAMFYLLKGDYIGTALCKSELVALPVQICSACTCWKTLHHLHADHPLKHRSSYDLSCPMNLRVGTGVPSRGVQGLHGGLIFRMLCCWHLPHCCRAFCVSDDVARALEIHGVHHDVPLLFMTLVGPSP